MNDSSQRPKVVPATTAEALAAGHLASIVESSDDAILSKDLDGIILSWNAGADRIFGYSADEMIGRPVRLLIPADLQSEEDEILAKVRRGERVDHFETVRVTKEGRKVHVSITVSPVRDHQGKVVGASKIARDITMQREAQARKDNFLAVLAHELRNPLGPIRNAISLLGEATLQPDQRERVRLMAARQSEHMARLLDDLLDVARLSTGKVELRKERVALSALVANAVEATRPQIESRRHTLTIRSSPEPLRLHVDPVRVTQILVNLLSNASKYTDPGGKIALNTERRGNEAVVSVTDTGIGFSEEMKPRLFELFSQSEDALDRSAGGLGIGLALVRDFVERHGGTIEAASEGSGRGSTFTLTLPLDGED